MNGFRLTRLSLSLWPFVIIAPGEVLGAALIRRFNPTSSGGWAGFADVLLAVGAGLLLATVCVVVARRLINRSRSVDWRSVPMAIVLYVAIAVLSGLLMVVMLLDWGPNGQPAVFSVLYMVSRPVNILIVAVVVQQAHDGIATTRAVDAITQDQLLRARRANEMIEAAERDLRAESLRMFATRVARPLKRIVRDGSELDSADLANRIDHFIDSDLRPMAHVLHPVTVRLGLIPAMRTLNPGVTVDAVASVERMDADGVLLDDGVRLQLYRWLRGSLLDGGVRRVALAVRGRDLQVSVYPATATPIDAVQSAAGLRVSGTGVIVAPLKGQMAELDVGTSPVAPSGTVPSGYRLRDLMTVHVPGRLGLVALLSLGAAPFQFVLYRWSPSVATFLVTCATAAAPILIAAVLDRLPPPRSTILGGWRVVAEWLLIGAAAAVALVALGMFFGLLPAQMSEWFVTLARMSYRYGIPGLLVTGTYGLVVVSQQRLRRAEEALAAEEAHRREILDDSRQLDRDVAEALHRTVQGRLAAAVVMLRLGQREEAWAQVIEMASVEVPWLLERMGDTRFDQLLVPDPPIGLTVVHVDEFGLGADVGRLLSRAAGEIAANARRHGSAATLVISTDVQGGYCRMTFDDDGSGLQGGAAPGLGSRLLDETATALGGSWDVESLPQGCRVVLEFPWPRSESATATERVPSSSSS